MKSAAQTSARQGINLLQDELRERKPVLPASQILLILGLSLLLIAALAVWMQQRAKVPRTELASIQTRIEQLEPLLETLDRELQARRPDPRLARDTRRLESRIAHLRRLTDLAASAATATPLSHFAAGLGRQRPDGLWLTRIQIASGGTDLQLSGRLIDPALLPTYLEALGLETAFAGRNLDQLHLTRPENNPGWLDFELRSGCYAALQPAANCPAPAGALQ